MVPSEKILGHQYSQNCYLSINGKAAGSLGKGTKAGIVDNKGFICQLDNIAKHWPSMWMIKESITECWKASLGPSHTGDISICFTGTCYSAEFIQVLLEYVNLDFAKSHSLSFKTLS